MQFSYSLSPPCWTKNGLYSLNTRPFHAISRRKYGKTPRLFPAQAQAERLLDPCILFDKSKRQSQLKPVQYSGKERPVLLSDDVLLNSPGISDAETTLPARGSSSKIDMRTVDAQVAEMAEKAEQALIETRFLQRKAWGETTVSALAPPLSIPDNLLDYALNETLEQSPVNPASNDFFGTPREKAWPGTWNPLAKTRIGTENVFMCAPTGRLDSLSVFNLKTLTKQNGELSQNAFRKGRFPMRDPVLDETLPIVDLVTSPYDVGSAEPGLAYAFTSNSLQVGDMSAANEAVVLDWKSCFSFPTTYSCALNPLCPTEFATLSREGLFCGTLDFYDQYCRGEQMFNNCFHDIQRLAEHAVYTIANYGVHPRTLLVANRKEIAMFDMRVKVEVESRSLMCNIRDHWNLPIHDFGISVFQGVQTRGYEMVVATQTCLNYIDIRMPHEPMLDWSISLPKPLDQACMLSLNDSAPRSEVIALSSKRGYYLEVFHAIREPVRTSATFRPVRGHANGPLGSWKPPPIPRRQLLWSDLPLSHLQQLRGNTKVSGMVLMPIEDEDRISLLQWSPAEGLTGQLLDVKAIKDDKVEAEGVFKVDGQISNSTLNMKNYLRRLSDYGDAFLLRKAIKPVTHGIGNKLLYRSQRMYEQDAVAVGDRLITGKDDDEGRGSGIRFPRVYMGDIRRIREVRKQAFKGRECSTDGVQGEMEDEDIGNGGKRNSSSESSGSSESSSEDNRGRRKRVSFWDSQETQNAVSGDIGKGKKRERGGNEKQGKKGRVKRRRGNGSESSDSKSGRIGDRGDRESSSTGEGSASGGESDGDSEKEQERDLPATQSSANMFEEESSSSSSSGGSSSQWSESSLSESDSNSESGSGSSEEEDEEMGDLLDEIGSGASLDEIGRVIRSGMAHNASPMEPDELKRMVEGSENVKWYNVEWHGECKRRHAGMECAVSTQDALPDWVQTRIYYTEDAVPGEAISTGWIKEGSAHWRFIKRMKKAFFDDEE